MNLEHLPQAILLAVVFLILAMGLWYLGLSRGNPKLKQIAVMVGAFPILAFTIQLLAVKFAPGPTTDFHDAAIFGPSAHRNGPATNETKFYVNTAGKLHRIELLPKVWGGDVPQTNVRVRYSVRSPSGEPVAEGESEAHPAKNNLLRWNSIFVEFQPREEGMHTLAIEVPAGVGSVDIRVKQVK